MIRPFKAVRPVVEMASSVSCAPYDVGKDTEVREHLRENPESFLRVTRPEVEALATEDSHEKARETLKSFLKRQTFITDPDPALYVYRLVTNGHTQTGIVGCLSLDEYESGLIKKHERTRPEKVEDRTEHMLSVRAQTGLILTAYRATDRLDGLLSKAAKSRPLYDFPSFEGTRQTVWKVTDTKALIDAFQEVPAVYIADGHHRVKSASEARTVLQRANAEHTGDEEYNYVLAGVFPAEELNILAYNRVVHDLNGLSFEELRRRIEENFVIIEDGVKAPVAHGDISMYIDERWYTLRFAVNYIREPDPVDRLDVTILQEYILRPILGIEDPTTDARIEFVGGAGGVGELERLVDSGHAAVAFSLFPTRMEDLLDVSDAGEIMPPKSTWFEPKLKDGLFVHVI